MSTSKSELCARCGATQLEHWWMSPSETQVCSGFKPHKSPPEPTLKDLTAAKAEARKEPAEKSRRSLTARQTKREYKAMKLSDRIRPNTEAAPWVIEEIKKLEDQNQQLKAAWDELSGAVQATQDGLDRYGPDWTNMEGEFVWRSHIEDYTSIVEQHQEAIAAGSGE